MNDLVIPEIVIPGGQLFLIFIGIVCALVLVLAVLQHSTSIKNLYSHKRLQFSGLAILGAILFVIASIALYNFLELTLWYSTETKNRHENARNYALTLSAILAVPFVIWRAFVAQQQANISEQGLLTDRLSKAIEQLGALRQVENGASERSLEIRLGAIYSLERIAQENSDVHVQIMEILCAYVRNNSPNSSAIRMPYNAVQDGKLNTTIFDEWRYRFSPISLDIQAVIDVIARRNSEQLSKESDAGYQIDLNHSNLQNVDFRGGNFTSGIFNSTYLDGSNIGHAKFGNTNLNGAEFNGCILTGANLDGAWCSLTTFVGTVMYAASTSFTAMDNCDLSHALQLEQTQLDTMIGSISTKIPSNLDRPKVWGEYDDELYSHWFEAKRKAGLPKLHSIA